MADTTEEKPRAERAKRDEAKAPARKPAAKKPAAKAAKAPVVEETVEVQAKGHESSERDVRDASARGYRKARRGYVVSDRMDKTITVEVEDRVKHPLYGKVIRRTSKVKAHDETNSAGIGDLVVINETRPLSATKRWRLVEILEKAK